MRGFDYNQTASKVKGRSSQAFEKNNKAFEVFKTTNHNMTLINALAKSYKWNRMVAAGEKNITDLAKDYKVSRTYISRMLNLMLLSPDIVESILSGKQPKGLRLKGLMKPFPIKWDMQVSVRDE